MKTAAVAGKAAAAVMLFSSALSAAPSHDDLVHKYDTLTSHIVGIMVSARHDRRFASDLEFTYDMWKDPRQCSVSIGTKDSANCWATVECNDGGTLEYNEDKAPWQNCTLGVRQFFTDPRIGQFSINFTQKDEDGSQGLNYPVLQLQHVFHWQIIDVSRLADETRDYRVCKSQLESKLKHDHRDPPSPELVRRLCDGPYICTHLESPTEKHTHGSTRMWKCGVPHAYARGNCRVVISQHHRPDVSVAREEIQIDLIDNNNDQIGGATTWADKEKYTHTDGAGRLPHAVEIQMGEEEDGTVNFKYGGYEWDSNSPNCTIEHPAVGDARRQYAFRYIRCYFRCE